MKRLTFVIVLIFLSVSLLAQVDRVKVLVEVATGTWCGYCPGAAMGIDDLIANGWPVAPVENHNSDPFANIYSNYRNTYNSFPGFGYPTAHFDGLNPFTGGSHTQSMYSNYWPRVQARMAIPSPFIIQMWGENTSGLTYDLLIRIEKVSTVSTSNLVLNVAITESDIAYVWQGQNHLNYVNRLMTPDQFGTPLDFSSGDVIDVNLTFNMQLGWDINNCDISAWVQDNDSHEAHQTIMVMVPWLTPPPPPLTADFISEDTLTCEGYPVYFEDMSAGAPTDWYWEFPGGTPDSSRVQNPVIVYETAGVYDVSLIVSDGIDTDTIVKEDYIEVLEITEAQFNPVDDQCFNYDPFELTEGSPAGGEYAGPGVIDGYFYPDVAGLGTHTLTYTYTNENDCSDTAFQTVMVDECVGIIENESIGIATLPNPTSGIFTLTLTSQTDQLVSVKVINLTGSIVYETGNIEFNRDFSTRIDLTEYSNGIYFIRVDNNKSVFYKKILLNK